MKVFVLSPFKNTKKILLTIICIALVLTLIITIVNYTKKPSSDSSDEAFIQVDDTVDVVAQARKILPIYSVKTDEKKIAITFDNAWGADDISSILSTLDKYNAKATFFVLGIWADKYPETMKEIVGKGHEIGNHSYSHKAPTKLSKEELLKEIQQCNESIKKYTGKDTPLYRAPSGDYNDFVVETAKSIGMTTIQWNVDSLDWRKDTAKDDIITRTVSRTKPGSILLFHNDTQYTEKVIGVILEQLKSQGYTFVTVSELIYKDNYTIDSQGVQTPKA